MTKGEVVKWLESLKKEIGKAENCTLWHYAESIDMAIEVLSGAGQPTGEWIDKGDYAECSNCGGNSGTQFDGVQPIPCKTKFCPHCGAKMGGEET